MNGPACAVRVRGHLAARQMAGGREKGYMPCICKPDPSNPSKVEIPFSLNGVSHLSSLIRTRSCANIT